MKKVYIFLLAVLLPLFAMGQNEFITIWKTDNPGASADEQIYYPGHGMNYNLDWEKLDDQGNVTHSGTVVVPNASQTSPYLLDFSASGGATASTGVGTYRLKATPGGGSFDRFAVGTNDPEKLIDVAQWGNTVWADLAAAFNNASNMTMSATDAPDLSQITNLTSMFSGATSFNTNIEHWDVSGITNMVNLFSEAEAFNQSLGNWDISSITNMSDMLSNSGLSIENYDNTLIEWSNASTIPNGITLGAENLEYFEAEDERFYLIWDKGWTIEGDSKGYIPFITVWKTDNPGDSNDDQIIFGTRNTNEVEWEKLDAQGNVTASGVYVDSTSSYYQAILIDFSASGTGTGPGTYRIKTKGIDGFNVRSPNSQQGNDPEKLIRVEQWGNSVWYSLDDAFLNASNMTLTATDAPNLSNTSDISFMFYQATSFNTDISHWDVSNISNFRSMFSGATNFNQPLNDWDVSSGTNFGFMFSRASAFNQPLNNWNVGNALALNGMFDDSPFDQPIGNWDVSKCEDFSGMFKGVYSKFNQDISGWDVSSGTNFSWMFWLNDDFVYDIGNWDVSSGTNFNSMFLGTEFNHSLNDWDVSSGTNFSSMFKNSEYNLPLDNWDVSSGEYFISMFSNSSFNQDISGWDVSSGKRFNFMLHACPFNQDISGWDVSNGTHFISMFTLSPFDQNLGYWNLSSAEDITNMFSSTNLSTANYDATLIGWANGVNGTLPPNITDQRIANTDERFSTNPNTPDNLDLGSIFRNYSAANQDARPMLIDTKGWTIDSDIYIEETISTPSGTDTTPTITGDVMNYGTATTLRVTDANNVEQTMELTANQTTFSFTPSTEMAIGEYTAEVIVEHYGIEYVLVSDTGNIESSILPIELLSFTAKIQNEKSVLLEWSSSMEINNDYYLLEKMDNNSNWKHFSKINSRGNSSIVQNYKELDTQISDGQNTYRLSQVDKDGTKTVLGIRNVNFEGTVAGVQIYPNPTTELIYINGLSKKDLLGVYNTYGRSINIISLNSDNEETLKLDVSSISPGLYTIRSTRGSYNFIKQ